MMQSAAEYGDVMVIVNSDKWLMRKKGYIFMPFQERCEIIRGFACVSGTTYVDDIDDTVCEALERIKPDYFANGGDRKKNNTPEMEVCTEHGIRLLWNIGGRKIQSSSELVDGAPILGTIATEFDGIELSPSRVEILQGSDIPKN
jgi:D-beta-D-heptose 7-phosphate kinase/D-beta-D-heptose 1-phosphate adenosyltransferase